VQRERADELAHRLGRAELERAEAERAAAAARAEAEQVTSALGDARVLAERERAEAERAAVGQAKILTRRVAAAIDTAAQAGPGTVRGPLRATARKWLRSPAAAGPTTSDGSTDHEQAGALAAEDPALAGLVAASWSCWTAYGALYGAGLLAPGSPALVELDKAETACWRATRARLRVLAGEVE
jgi:hypothetical protein